MQTEPAGDGALIGAHHREDLWSLAVAERAAVEEDRRRGEEKKGAGLGRLLLASYVFNPRAGHARQSGGREQCFSPG